MPKQARLFATLILLALLLSASVAPLEASPREISVAAAADLSIVLPEIAQAFEKTSDVSVRLSFGASGGLTQQIENGAPFDAFLSADMGYPKQLVSEGKADGATLRPYAVGGLVLWTQANSPLDIEHEGMKVLLDSSIQKIAIANPEHAPYGRAAVAAMKHYGLYEKLSGRIVLGENISQAAQFVESGNAQVGFVALAHALAPAMKGKGKYWKVPAEAYPPLEQGAVIVAHSPHAPDAQVFLEFMKSAEARAILQHYGFTSPDEK